MWTLRPDERLRAWRRFRLDLAGLDTLQCLERVVNLWSTTPVSNQYFAPDLPETWPDPWQLIYDGYWDELAISLGVFYTLVLSDNFSEDLVKYCVYAHDKGITSIVIVDNQYAIGYEHNTVSSTSDIPPEWTLRWTWHINDISDSIKG